MANLHIKQDGDKILTQAVINGIDTTNIVATSPLTNWVATQDGIIAGYLGDKWQADHNVTIDGVVVARSRPNSNQSQAAYSSICIPIKNGQKLSINGSDAKVFGVNR